MIDNNIRNLILENKQDESEIILLENPSFDRSILGLTSDNRVIYDYNKMIEELMEDDNCSFEDAEEFIQYNTIRAIGYFGPQKPIINYSIK